MKAGPKFSNASIIGTYQRMCGLVEVDVLEDSAHKEKDA